MASVLSTIALMFAGLRLRRGKAGQGGELVHQRAHCFDRSADGFGATVQNFERSRIGRRAALQMPADALRRERDGGQRVLDLVRHPARHFAPGCLLLRLEQVGQIFEDQHIAQPLASMLQRGHGDGRVERERCNATSSWVVVVPMRSARRSRGSRSSRISGGNTSRSAAPITIRSADSASAQG